MALERPCFLVVIVALLIFSCCFPDICFHQHRGRYSLLSTVRPLFYRNYMNNIMYEESFNSLTIYNNTIKNYNHHIIEYIKVQWWNVTVH